MGQCDIRRDVQIVLVPAVHFMTKDEIHIPRAIS